MNWILITFVILFFFFFFTGVRQWSLQEIVLFFYFRYRLIVCLAFRYFIKFNYSVPGIQDNAGDPARFAEFLSVYKKYYSKKFWGQNVLLILKNNWLFVRNNKNYLSIELSDALRKWRRKLNAQIRNLLTNISTYRKIFFQSKATPSTRHIQRRKGTEY